MNQSFLNYFTGIEDPRIERTKRYPLDDKIRSKLIDNFKI
jgi:hypothetical protein